MQAHFYLKRVCDGFSAMGAQLRATGYTVHSAAMMDHIPRRVSASNTIVHGRLIKRRRATVGEYQHATRQVEFATVA
jgi:hypothetical protein